MKKKTETDKTLPIRKPAPYQGISDACGGEVATFLEGLAQRGGVAWGEARTAAEYLLEQVNELAAAFGDDAQISDVADMTGDDLAENGIG